MLEGTASHGLGMWKCSTSSIKLLSWIAGTAAVWLSLQQLCSDGVAQTSDLQRHILLPSLSGKMATIVYEGRTPPAAVHLMQTCRLQTAAHHAHVLACWRQACAHGSDTLARTIIRWGGWHTDGSCSDGSVCPVSPSRHLIHGRQHWRLSPIFAWLALGRLSQWYSAQGLRLVLHNDVLLC